MSLQTCPVCRGVGKIGIPGKTCGLCGGRGQTELNRRAQAAEQPIEAWNEFGEGKTNLTHPDEVAEAKALFESKRRFIEVDGIRVDAEYVRKLRGRLDSLDWKLQKLEAEQQQQEPVGTIEVEYHPHDDVTTYLFEPLENYRKLIDGVHLLYTHQQPQVRGEPKEPWHEVPEDSIDRLMVGKGTEGDQMLAVAALEEAAIYADLYSEFTDQIEPFVQRMYKAGGEDMPLPASLHGAFNIFFDHWLADQECCCLDTEENLARGSCDFCRIKAERGISVLKPRAAVPDGGGANDSR